MGDSDNDIHIPDIPDGYKKPRPPKWKKRDVFNVEKMAEVDKNAKQVQVKDGMTYEDLTNSLTSGLKSDLEKVRALFTWLGHQDIEGMKYKQTGGGTPLGYMALMKEGRGAYEKFFALLCRAANLPCVIIGGCCKGTGYEIGDQDVTMLGTSWNAVFVDGSWQIVHPMWAFTAVVGHDTGAWTKIEGEGKAGREKAQAKKGKLIRHVDEFLFLPHPEEFIYDCIADDDEWQLLKKPWDLRKFCNVPRFSSEYFTSDFKLRSAEKSILTSCDGKCELEFTEREGTKTNLNYELFFNEQESKEELPSATELPRTVFFETEGNKLRLLIWFHVIGVYKLSVGTSSTTLATFRLEAKEKSKNKNMLPVCPSIWFGFGHTAKDRGLQTPSQSAGVVVAKANISEMFTFYMKTVSKVIARLRHDSESQDDLNKLLTKTTQGNSLSIKVTLPSDSGDQEYALQIYLGSESPDNNVLNYILTTRKNDFVKMQNTISVRLWMLEQKLRFNLAAALMLPKKSHTLEKHMKAFEEAHLQDTNGYFRKGKVALKQLKQEEEEETRTKKLKRRVTAAMRSRDLEAMREAVEEAERSDSEEVQELVQRANLLMMEIEQREIEKARARVLEEELEKVAESEDREELEEAISVFMDEGVHSNKTLLKAKTNLCQLYEKAVEEAMEGGKEEEIQKSVRKARTSVVARELKNSEVLDRAEQFLQKQKRLSHLRPALELKTQTLAEIQAYKNPRPVTRDVMKSIFVILGEHPKKMENWSAMQVLLRPNGGVLRRMKQTKPEALHEHTRNRVGQLLEKYTSDDAREVSAGVVTLFEWSQKMIQEEASSNHDD